MALQKTGYTPAIQGKTRANVAINEDGYIATEGDTIAGNKYFTIKQANAENSLVDNQDVINFFIGLVSGSTDSTTNTMTVTWEV